MTEEFEDVILTACVICCQS